MEVVGSRLAGWETQPGFSMQVLRFLVSTTKAFGWLCMSSVAYIRNGSGWLSTYASVVCPTECPLVCAPPYFPCVQTGCTLSTLSCSMLVPTIPDATLRHPSRFVARLNEPGLSPRPPTCAARHFAVHVPACRPMATIDAREARSLPCLFHHHAACAVRKKRAIRP